MEKVLQIKKVLPVVQKTTQATPFDQKPARTYCIGQYLASDGLNTSFMEKLASNEKDLPKVEEGKWYNVQFHLEVREYTDTKTEQTRYFQRVVLDRIAEITNTLFNN